MGMPKARALLQSRFVDAGVILFFLESIGRGQCCSICHIYFLVLFHCPSFKVPLFWPGTLG